MRKRNHKSIAISSLGLFCLGLCCLWTCGCSDNPEAKAAKEVRQQTTQAVQMSVEDRNYEAAQNKVEASLENNRPKGLTKDAALLASGNLALAKGQQMQADLGLRGLPLRGSADELERLLRSSEQLLVERERIEAILESDLKEVAELQQLLTGGDAPAPALSQQHEQESAQLQKLVAQKTSLQKEKEQVQSILDQSQADADALKRQAEQAVGDRRLKLEKEAAEILLNRKEHYITVQEMENEIAVLDGEIELAQVRVDGVTQGIEDIETRIEQIETSQSRQALTDQVGQINTDLNNNEERMDAIASELQAGLTSYRQTVEKLRTIYDEAVNEFEKVQSSNARFTAIVCSASGYQNAAMACSTFVRTHNNLTERLQGLIDTADESYVPILQRGLPTQQELNTAFRQKAFQYFDKASEAYQEALSAGGSRDKDTRCSLLKSQVLAIHSKMKLADRLGKFDLANAAETSMDAVIQEGTKLGDCFTQSEAMRVINKGLNYLPKVPLDMEAFVDRKREELSAWKGLSIEEQKAAVEENLNIIDDLTAEYGQDLARQLESLKQEMLTAKESGFTGAPSGTAGPGDPNSTSYGEPNSMY